VLPQPAAAIAQFESHARRLFPGSRFALQLADGRRATLAAVAGPGEIASGEYVVPARVAPADVTLVAAAPGSIAARALRLAAPPPRDAIAVASYDDGIVFHDPRTFAVLGTLATGGSPSDVVASGARVTATDTDGNALTTATLRPWSVGTTESVPLGDELAADAPLDALFVTERDLDGKGGLARVTRGSVRSVVTGTTAEGVVVDIRRQLVYVADTNDDAVCAVDARSMRVLHCVGGIPRAFSVALSADGSRLYVVSNQGLRTPFSAPGSVIAIASGDRPHVVARSGELAFPVGVAFDPANGDLLVTDEQADEIYVLDPRTLRPRRAPVSTCQAPWKPYVDARSDRLFVPCAQSDEVDAFDARTLGRVRGAPFATGGFPLAVTVVRS